MRHFDVNQNILQFEHLLETEIHPTERVRLLHLLLKEIDKVGHYSIVHLIEVERQIARNEKFISIQRALVARLNGTETFAKVAENLLRTMIQTQELFKMRRERIANSGREIQAHLAEDRAAAKPIREMVAGGQTRQTVANCWRSNR